MTTKLDIALVAGRKEFEPGDLVEGVVSWNLPSVPKALQLFLLYFTQGKGNEDAIVVETIDIASSQAQGVEQFSFAAPSGPYSFSGRLISLIWALELVAEDSGTKRTNIVIAPEGREVKLQAAGKIKKGTR